MEMDSLISVLESLKENSESFFTNDGDDAIWREDVEALNQIIPILTACKHRGVKNAEELADILDSYSGLMTRYQKMIEKYTTPQDAKKIITGRWLCPSCSEASVYRRNHCHKCGQRLGWPPMRRNGGNTR